VSLLEELVAAWPPAEDLADSGYVRTSLAEAIPLAATALRPYGERGLAVVLARHPSGRLMLGPLVREGAGWRRARPRDGASAALVEALASGRSLEGGFQLRQLGEVGHLRGERAIGVDQTNESVVVGGSVVVKWLAEPNLRPASVPDLQAHLAALDYRGVPAPLGSLVWTDTSGARAPLAFLTTWLPDARDGWDWCVQDVLEHLEHPGKCPADCAARTAPRDLARATAGLHAALATPTDVIPEPVGCADQVATSAWMSDALDALGTALQLVPPAAARELRDREAGLRDRIGRMGGITDTPIQHIHGDLHVGQVLSSHRGLAIIDLDDDISVDPMVRGRPLPVARDVAQMTCSLDHVGRLADRRTSGRHRDAIERWIGDAQADYLTTYRTALAASGTEATLDDRLLDAFVAERICREIVYAARVLPRWLDAPMGTLRRVVPA
jgi:maltokinase